MKKLSTLSLVLVASVAAVLVPASNAFADRIVLNGSACQHYNPGEANLPNYFVDGVKNSSTITRSIICPLPIKHTAGQATGSVYVDTDSTVGFSCTLYSYSDTDVPLGSKFGNIASGKRSTYIGTVPANTYSSASVLCSVPGNNVAQIVAIEANF